MLRLRALFIALSCSLALPRWRQVLPSHKVARRLDHRLRLRPGGQPAGRREDHRYVAHPDRWLEAGLHQRRGQFRVRQLFPGKFQVSASAPKLKTVIQKDVKVGITSAAEVNIVMEVQTGDVEEVRVVEKAPDGQHHHHEREGGLRPRLRRVDALQQPRSGVQPDGGPDRRRGRQPRPRRRRQPDHHDPGRLRHAGSVPGDEGLGRLRDPERRLRRRQRHRLGRRRQPGDQDRLEQVGVRVQRHRRERHPALRQGQPRQPRQLLLPGQPGPGRSDHQGQAVVRLHRSRRTSWAAAATPTPRASCPRPAPTSRASTRGR